MLPQQIILQKEFYFYIDDMDMWIKLREIQFFFIYNGQSHYRPSLFGVKLSRAVCI